MKIKEWNYDENSFIRLISVEIKEKEREYIEIDGEEYYWQDGVEQGDLLIPLTTGKFPIRNFDSYIIGLDDVLICYIAKLIDRCGIVMVYLSSLYQYAVSKKKDYFGDDYSGVSLAICMMWMKDKSLREYYLPFLYSVYINSTLFSELSVFSWVALLWIQERFPNDARLIPEVEKNKYSQEEVERKYDELINEDCEHFWSKVFDEIKILDSGHSGNKEDAS